jgi:hypothetical protein
MLKYIVVYFIAFVAAAIHCRQPKQDNREDTERKVELAAISHARRSGSHTKVAKSAYQFYTVMPLYKDNLENKYKCYFRQVFVISENIRIAMIFICIKILH